MVEQKAKATEADKDVPGTTGGAGKLLSWTGSVTVWHAVALGLVVRLIVLAFLPDQNFPDTKAYLAAGRGLLTVGRTLDHTYMPLYPIWTYLAGGGVTLKLADIVLSLATIWIIFALSLTILKDRLAALLGAFVAALWPHFAFYAVVGLTETAYVFILCLAFLMLYRRHWWWGIVFLVLSILVRPTLEPLIPVLIVVFVVVVHRESWRQAGILMAKLALVYVVLMSPWWLVQYQKYGQFVRLNLGSGVVLYSGNNPHNKSGGGVGYNAGDSRKSDHDPNHPAWRIQDPIARNAALTRAALVYIRDNPGRFATLAAIKLKRFWRLWPYAQEYQSVAIIAVSLMSYGVFLLGAIVFLAFHASGRWRALAPILLLTVFLSLVHMVTIGSIRYRFPIEPFLIILGSYTVARLIVRFGHTRDV